MSLLVGGIGIMNIMLVSVTERTKEIGIRKALGATKLTIMLQFLVEALVLCISGGTLGILIGVAASIFVSKQYGTTTVISPVAIVSSFAFSGLVGLFFGLWPAQAGGRARPDPGAAIRIGGRETKDGETWPARGSLRLLSPFSFALVLSSPHEIRAASGTPADRQARRSGARRPHSADRGRNRRRRRAR